MATVIPAVVAATAETAADRPSSVPICTAPDAKCSQDEESEEDDNDDASAWHVLTTLYLPILLLWLRRSMFGTANVIRSVILGQLLHLLLTVLAPSVDSSTEQSWWEPAARWLHLAVAGTSAAPSKHDAWPPPALTALAMLTVFCFVVHPDGLTWIMLGKLRDTVLALLRSSTTLWTMLIHDYGIISTIAAAMTLAAIGCLLFIMLRTITPRKLQSHSHHQLQQLPEKKKKKRKGQYPRGRSRIRPSSLSTTTKVIPEEESSNDGFDETPPQQQHVVAVDEPERLVLLDPVPEAREPEIAIRPRIQSYSTVESATASIDDQSTTSSVRSFGSAPTVQTTFTTNSERSGKSSVAPAFDVPMAKGKMTMSKSGKKKIALMMKKGTNLAVERGDGQLTPEYPFRSPNTTTQASKGPKSVRIIDKEYSKDFRATSSPCRSEQKPRVEGTTSRRGHARQLRANYHDPKPAPVSPLPPPIDTDSFFSAPISPYSASNLNASTAPYTPNHMPSHSLGPIGSTPPRLELSYSAPSYTQPYSQQLSPRWGTPVRPPPGLGGLLTSPSHQFGVTLYAYEQDDENLDEGDSRIEAELQELGGQMVGSILDF